MSKLKEVQETVQALGESGQLGDGPLVTISNQLRDAFKLTPVVGCLTCISQVAAALREFASANLTITGIALAQIDPRGMRRYGYGGKYGAYGAYGRGYYEAA